MRRILPFLRDNRGLQTLEWVALGLVILALVAAVSFYITYQASESTGRTVGETIQALFECVERLDFDCARELFQTRDQPERPRRDLWWCITNPLECWTEVVWPGIKGIAQQIWRRIETVGESIYKGLEAAWSWIQQQWNTWLKGALAGLLAGLLILAVVVVLKVGIIVGLVALAIAIIVGVIAQLTDPSGGFLKYFITALLAGLTAVMLVTGGITAGILKILKFLKAALKLLKLKAGVIPTLVSIPFDVLWNLDKLDLQNPYPWLIERLINAVLTYLTSVATYGLARNLGNILNGVKQALRAGSPLKAIARHLPGYFANISALISINFGGMYLGGILTGNMPGAKEYAVTGLVTLITATFFGIFPIGDILESAISEFFTRYFAGGPPKIFSRTPKSK